MSAMPSDIVQVKGNADDAEAEVARLREELAKAQDSCARWIGAAMAATMPDEFGLAFDPTAPEAWAVTRRRTIESALNARDVAKAELAPLRALAVEAKDGEAAIGQPDTTLLQTAQILDDIRARHARLAALAPKEADD